MDFVNTRLMTRQTYTLEGIKGDMSTQGGNIKFVETDGIDFAPTTVKLPTGEYQPFLFTVKNLTVKGEGTSLQPGFSMGGDFTVPSYRTGGFLDPKNRGMYTGYDQAVALPALQASDGQEELFKETNKVFDIGKGAIEMEVNKVNSDIGEIGGVFVSKQPSDRHGRQVPQDDPAQGHLLWKDRRLSVRSQGHFLRKSCGVIPFFSAFFAGPA